MGAKTENGIRIILVACGNWAEGRGWAAHGPLLGCLVHFSVSEYLFFVGRNSPPVRPGAP